MIVEGTATMSSIIELLPRFHDGSAPNVKIVATSSYELFQLQPKEYRDKVSAQVGLAGLHGDSNGSRIGMHPWLSSKVAEQYAMTSDHDNRWRTGGLPGRGGRGSQARPGEPLGGHRALRGRTRAAPGPPALRVR